MKIITISMKNSLGQERRGRLNYDYRWFKASNYDKVLPYIKERTTHYWNSGEKGRRGKEGTNDSYYRLVKHIITKKLSNIIITEDDCFLKEEEYALFLKNLPTELCYLNGRMAQIPRPWKPYHDFDKTMGTHEIDYNTFKIIGTWGIYIPHYSMLEPLWDRLSNPKRNKLRGIDVMIINDKLIKHYFYPSVFLCDEYDKSHVRTSKGQYWDNYTKISNKNRKINI